MSAPAPSGEARPIDELVEFGRAKCNGIELHYATMGEGPLVVLLHGFPEFWFSWRYQIPALAAAGYRVVAPDLRGYNKSDKPSRVRDYSVDELVADVDGLIEALGEERAAMLVGHDWGGAIAWTFAERHPERLDKLAICNMLHIERMFRALRTPRQLSRSWYTACFQVPLLPELFTRAGNAAMIRRSLKSALAPDADDIDRYIEAYMRPGVAKAAIHYYRAGLRHGFGKRVPITCPTLVVFGEEDPFLGVEWAAPREDLVPDCQVQTIPGVGHWVQVEAAEQVNSALLGFLGAAGTNH